MLYTITGADRTTGRDVTQTIDAKSARDAESIASLTMMVSKVTAVVPVEPLKAAPANDLEAAVLEAGAKPQVGYARAAKRDWAAGVDWSKGLASEAWFLRVLSWPVAACAIPFALMGVKDLLEAIYLSGATGILRFLDDFGFWRFVIALILLATAVFLRVVAHAALAVRHVATRGGGESPEKG